MKQECPMCREWMRLEPVEQVSRIAGTNQMTMRHALEWRCPDCDYFEEFDDKVDGLSPELQAWMES